MDSGASRDNGASWGASASWDTPADPSITSANGNHPAKHASRGPFDAAFTVLPDPAERTEPAQDQDFSWLDNSQPESRPAEPADRGYAWPERADASLAAQPEAEPAPEPAGTERIPRHQADGLTSPERTDFWAKPSRTSAKPRPRVGSRPRPTCSRPRRRHGPRSRPSRQRPGPRLPTPQRLRRQNPLSGPRPTSLRDGHRDGRRGAAAQLGRVRRADDRSQRDDRRKDRFFPVRLLAVIVIAALIGSALVLLLK